MPVTNVESALAEKFARLLPHLNERQRRLTVAAEAAALGRGGVSVAARASGLSRPTAMGDRGLRRSQCEGHAGPGPDPIQCYQAGADAGGRLCGGEPGRRRWPAMVGCPFSA